MARLPIVDNLGKIRTIDESEYNQAIQDHGYRPLTQQENQQYEDQQKYGEGFVNEALAGIAGAARGATLGLSDQLLTKTGIVNPETLRSLEEYNPAASGVGEVAGAVLPTLLTGGETLPESAAEIAGKDVAEKGFASKVASSAPSSLVSDLGASTTESARPIASKLAEIAASKETSPAMNRILENAISGGIGSAVEGAAYGLGQSVSEEALGDPDLNAEKVFANVGMGALFGGAIGSAFEGVGSILKKGESEIQPLVPKPDATSFEDVLQNGATTQEEKSGLLSRLKEKKENAGEITEAANTLGVPTFAGQISDNDHIQKLWSMMSQSPTHIGEAEASAVNSAFDTVSNQVKDILKPDETLTLAQLGDRLKDSLTEKFETENAPIKELYDTLGDYGQAIPVTSRSTSSIGRNISKIIKEQGLIKGSPARQFVDNVVSSLGEISDLNTLKTFRTNLYKNAPIEAKWVAGAVKEKLDNLEVNAIKRYADTMKTGVAKDKILSLIDTAEMAKSSYRKMYDRMSEFGDVLGKRKIRGPQDFLDFLNDGRTPEQLAEKLFQNKNSEFTSFFKDNFPQEWQSIAQYQKGKLLEKSLKDGNVNIQGVIRNVDKLEPEMKKALFSDSELKTMKAAKTYVEAFPKKFNPSESATALGWMNFLKNPFSAANNTVRDAGIKSGFRALGLSTEGQAKIKALSIIEKAASKVSASISKAAKAVVFGSKIALIANHAVPSFADSDSKRADLLEYASNPEKLIDKLNDQTQHAYAFAPNTVTGINMATTRATAFLASKAPVSIQSGPLGAEIKPSKSEISKFKKYCDAVMNPLGAFDQIQNGTLSAETMETLNSVYPKLLQEMQKKTMESIIDAKNKKVRIPYFKRINLSLFMGQDLDGSLDPVSIQLNQTAIGQSAKENEIQNAKFSQAAVKDINQSKRSLTPMQSAAMRTDA